MAKIYHNFNNLVKGCKQTEKALRPPMLSFQGKVPPLSNAPKCKLSIPVLSRYSLSPRKDNLPRRGRVKDRVRGPVSPGAVWKLDRPNHFITSPPRVSFSNCQLSLPTYLSVQVKSFLISAPKLFWASTHALTFHSLLPRLVTDMSESQRFYTNPLNGSA